jgi:hypothetical protein
MIWTKKTFTKGFFCFLFGVFNGINTFYILSHSESFRALELLVKIKQIVKRFHLNFFVTSFEYESKFFMNFVTQTQYHLHAWLCGVILGYFIEIREELTVEKVNCFFELNFFYLILFLYHLVEDSIIAINAIFSVLHPFINLFHSWRSQFCDSGFV